MQYMLIQYTYEPDATDEAARAAAEDMAPGIAYTQKLIDAGVMRGGHGLQPPTTATVVRKDDGKAVVQDGPFVDSKAQLGGYYIIEANDLDHAIALAGESPATAYGGVEIRPVIETD